MFEEDDGTFESGASSLLVLAIKDPAKTAIAEISDDGLDSARNCATDSTTSIATNSLADSSDALADLREDTLDNASNSIVGGDGSKAFLDDFATSGDWVVWEFASGDTLGHHGDLTGSIGVG